MPSTRKTPPPHVFLNVPFDKQNQNIYLALIAGLSVLGLTPRSVLEIATTSARLSRLLALIAACPYSVHDLSRVQLSRAAPRCPRFNMPFELGITIALANTSNKKHYWIVLESSPYRLQKSLSDLNGYDYFLHNGRVTGVFQALLDAFDKSGTDPAHMRRVYRRLRVLALKLMATYRWDDLFKPTAFRRLVSAAARIARTTAR